MNTAAARAGCSSWRRMSASASATVASADSTIGSLVMRPPAVSGPYLQERADVFGLFGLHEVEQLLGALLGQLAEQVGGVVGLHRVEDVGGALVAELLEDVHLLVLGHLLERVGEPLVGELLGDLDHALVRQVEQGVREVGGLEVGEGRDELLGGLRLAGNLLLAHLRPVRERRRSLRERRGARARAAQEELTDIPLAEPVALDRDVLDDGGARSVDEVDAAAEQLGHDPHLAAALLEAAHVDEAGRDDLAGRDGGDAADRDEHVPAAGDLDDETDDARRIVLAIDDDDVADLAEPVAGGVEDGAPGQARDEDPLRAHAFQRSPRDRGRMGR